MELPLTESDRVLLKQTHRKTKDKRVADRIKIINLLDIGYTPIEIARALMLDEETVSSWKKKFIESESMDDWLSMNYIPYHGRLTSNQISELRVYIENTIVSDSKQLIPFIKEKFGVNYSERGVRNLLRLMNFRYKQLIQTNPKVDAEIQNQFIQGFESLNENLSEDEAIIFLDGVHPQHNTHTAKAWIQAGKELHIPCNTGRNRLNLNGAYNPNTGEVFIKEGEKVDDCSI